MTKRSRKKSGINKIELESEEMNINPMGSDQVVPEGGPVISVQNTQEEIVEMSKMEESKEHADENSVSESTPDLSDDVSVDDLLDHVRQSFVTKKNLKKKNIRQVETKSSEETDAKSVESDKFEPVIFSQSSQEVVMETSWMGEPAVSPNAISTSENTPDSSDETPLDDLLDDVRHSLIEDESAKNEKKPKWWNRIVKGKQDHENPHVETPDGNDANLLIATAPIPVKPEVEEREEYVEQIDELIKLLETDETGTQQENTPASSAQMAPPVEQESRIDVDELKKQAFSPRPNDGKSESYSEVRTIALDDGEEVFVEVESKAANSLDDRIKGLENALRPYRRYIYYVIAFLGVIMAVIALMMVYTAYKQSLPEPQVTDVASLPYPTSLRLPGGVNFSLGKGKLDDGKWNPRGPEWLEGTEICRWVSIPWSRQLEAVIRTFTQDDQIELLMSNNDRLVYQVYSIQQLTISDMQKLDSGSPCLLLVLADAKSEDRWVVTAIP